MDIKASIINYEYCFVPLVLARNVSENDRFGLIDSVMYSIRIVHVVRLQFPSALNVENANSAQPVNEKRRLSV